MCFVELCAHTIPNISNSVQTQRNPSFEPRCFLFGHLSLSLLAESQIVGQQMRLNGM